MYARLTAIAALATLSALTASACAIDYDSPAAFEFEGPVLLPVTAAPQKLRIRLQAHAGERPRPFELALQLSAELLSVSPEDDSSNHTDTGVPSLPQDFRATLVLHEPRVLSGDPEWRSHYSPAEPDRFNVREEVWGEVICERPCELEYEATVQATHDLEAEWSLRIDAINQMHKRRGEPFLQMVVTAE